ncbi:MAG: hypothetical protein PW844_07415 [Pantoea sp.]|uniref:hypothetical protein n=1 Tax=Pantoea sp. TaxID=69393 RepID=UPI0023936CDB|nr:hypothetical protein [Pantoea sp.]MDE1186289.1 hypothetical protein [Pantoea sp.]
MKISHGKRRGRAGGRERQQGCWFFIKVQRSAKALAVTGAEGGRRKAEGRRQKAEGSVAGRSFKAPNQALCLPRRSLSHCAKVLKLH